MIPTQTLLTENALAEEFVSAFRERRLAEKFFYWFPLSVRAWLALCSDGAYRNYVRSRSLIARPDHLAALAPDPETPARLVLLLGNTLGAFDPIAEARELRGLLRPGDLLIVDGELYGDETTLAGYDNPLNRRFAWAPLHAVGIRDSDGELVFEARDDTRLPGLHVIAKHFRAGRPVAALMGGEELRLDAGERLAMSHSYKYAPETLLRILGDVGLAVRWQGTSDDRRFLMALAGPA